jgi:hypothetical protein
LFRRRQVWLPTVWGTLLLAALATAIGVPVAAGLGHFLAPTEPASGPDGRGARTLIVEGWLDPAGLDDAVAAIARGSYERVVTSGGPLEGWERAQGWPTYAERAAHHVRGRVPGGVVVVAVPSPATLRDRTYASAVVIRQWAERQGLAFDRVDLFTSGVHARRSRLVYGMAFGPKATVGVIAAPPRHYPLDRWWTTSEGAKSVLGETVGMVWTKCCFWPASPAAEEEREAAPKPPA